MEFADGGVESSHRLRLQLPVPLLAGTGLGKHNDALVPLRETLEGGSQAGAYLALVIIPSLAAAVQVEDHRPVVTLAVARRERDAVAVVLRAEVDGPLEEARAPGTRHPQQHDQQRKGRTPHRLIRRDRIPARAKAPARRRPSARARIQRGPNAAGRPRSSFPSAP